jgi:hypothetical protein
MKLEGLDRHHRPIGSYKKLHAARAKELGFRGLKPQGIINMYTTTGIIQ